MRPRRKLIVGCLVVALAGTVCFLFLWPREPQLYSVTILPSLGGDHTVAYAINDRGQVAGISRLANGAEHLFLWSREGGMRDLGPVVNDAVWINNHAQIAATMRDPNDRNRAFVWDPNRGRCVLPTLGGDHAEPYALNDVGQVVGVAETASGAGHVFIWDATRGIGDLTPSSTGPVRVFSINDAGQVVVFTGGGSLLLETKEGQVCSSQPLPFSPAFHINNAGDIVGLSRRAKGRVGVVVWNADSGTKQVSQLKRTVPGMPKINDVGQVFYCQARRPEFRFFGRTLFTPRAGNYLWDPQRGTIALDGYVDVGRDEDLVITDLNEHGCLVGFVESKTGRRRHSVLLEPIPEQWDK